MGKPEITRKNIILASIKLAKENGLPLTLRPQN